MLQSLTHCQYPVAVLRYSSVNCATQPAIYLTSFSTSGRAQLIAAGTITGKNEDGVTYLAVPRQSSTHDLHRAPSVTLPSTKLVEQKKKKRYYVFHVNFNRKIKCLHILLRFGFYCMPSQHTRQHFRRPQARLLILFKNKSPSGDSKKWNLYFVEQSSKH